MLSNRLALIGGLETGKTTLLAALRAKYGALPDPPFPDDEHVAKLLNLKREHCASFVFTGKMGVVDLDGKPLDKETDRWDADMTEAAKRLRREPLDYPGPTGFPHRHWADITFLSHHIGTKQQVGTYPRRFSIDDVPGGSLDPGSKFYNAQTVEALEDADALIIFIDMTAALEANSDQAQRLLALIISIIKTASAKPIYKERFIPVSVLFTKADKAVPPERLSDANNLFFKRYTLPLSRASQAIQVMSCPISVEDPDSHLFRPKNIHLPFLFSAMGIIHSQALRAKAVAEGMKTLSWWHKQKIGENVKSLLAQAYKDSKLTEAIRDTLCSEYIIGNRNIRFARDGEENSAHQIGFSI